VLSVMLDGNVRNRRREGKSAMRGTIASFSQTWLSGSDDRTVRLWKLPE